MTDARDSAEETLEVPVPEDTTISGGRRTQGVSDQLFMLAVGGGLLAAGLMGFSSVPPALFLVAGGFVLGNAFERLQWITYGKYGSFRNLIRSVFSTEEDS